jgi:hypothetical protein
MLREIVPLLVDNPAANRATFEAFDEAHGRIDRMGFVHPSSLAHLWDQLLVRRGNHIRIEFDERSGKWGIDNGRHRALRASGISENTSPRLTYDLEFTERDIA